MEKPLTIRTIVSKHVSALYTLPRLVIAFLPKSKCLLISWLQSPSAVFLKSKKTSFVTAPTFSPSICHEVMGPGAIILLFWMCSFKPAFSLTFFTFIKRLFRSASLSAIRVASSAYLRLLLFLLAALIPACESSSHAFYMMYFAVQPQHILFPILNQIIVPSPVLTFASWPAHRFLKRQVWYSHLLKNFPQFVVIHTVNGFRIVNEAEIDVFLEFPCFLHDSTDVNLISGVSTFTKPSLYIWKLLFHEVYLEGFWA